MTKIFDPISRRQFLTSMSALSLTGVSVLSDSGQSLAQSSDDDYRALVCVFLAGGMDHNDTLIPYDTDDYDALRSVRNQLFSGYSDKSIARDRDDLLPLDPINTDATQGRQFAVPKELNGLRELFNDEELCFVGGVGALIEPVTRATYSNRSVQLPPALFSHNDQQNYFQGLAIEGAQAGWGGRFIDALTAEGKVGENPQYATISTRGNNLFLAGVDSNIFHVGTNAVQGPQIERLSAILGDGTEMNAVRAKLRSYFRNATLPSDQPLNVDMHLAQASAMIGIDGFGDQYNNLSPLSTSFANVGFANELKAVANAIRASRNLGLKRQVYFVSYGNFDSHRNQFNKLPGMQNTLSAGIKSFSDAMKELGMWDDVTLFSGGDFGRAMVSNGGGTDHGWGSHQFVTGGRVKGRRIIGKMPGYNVNSEEYTAAGAKLIPTVAIEQYGAALGRWLGVNNDDINAIMPNLRNFSSVPLDLFEA